MAKNPMQKKATNAFLLGIIITLLIVALIGGVYYVLYILPKQRAAKDAAVQITTKDVYVIKQPVKSGESVVVGLNAEIQKIETGLAQGIDPNGATAKIDLEPGTIITSSMLVGEEKLENDVRLVEYNMITLPLDIYVGDYIDIRLTIPSGQDYIVISKKPVISINEDIIGLNLSEDEILIMNSAIVEGYMMTASNIYATKYVEPGIQDKAIPTYPVNAEVYQLIKDNDNIIEQARNSYLGRYKGELRNKYINADRAKYIEDELDNVETGLAEQIQKSKEARQQYLTGITE